MKIGEIARKTGCQVVTIRYYEKEGLLSEPQRTEGNYRIYGPKDIERLEFIMHCRKHDMKLEEIRKLLSFKDGPEEDCTWITDLINTHIDNVNAQIRSLELLKEHLEQLGQRCAGGRHGENCGIIQGLDNPDLCCATHAEHQVA
jgi:Cd(II)/Pb(II)-responsive transcriptional regulator